MGFWDYEGMRVKITDVNGNTHIGVVDFYTSELDDPDGVGYLSLHPDGMDDILVDFCESEITDIESLSVDLPSSVMARAV